ncbi:MAG: oligosaccharide flippase family protein [Bacteroidota bacterium]
MIARAKALLNTKSEFRKNIFVLLTGTGIAQAIPILISPILTRIYSPGDFGIFGLYSACAAILSVFATGRYDLSIIEPKKDTDARLLMLLSLYISVFFSCMLFLIVVLFNGPITNVLGDPRISIWLYSLPLTVFAVSCFSVFSYWMNRKKMYKEMSMNRVVSSVSISSFSLGLGFIKAISGGLIVGYILGQFFTVLLLRNRLLKTDYKLKWKRSLVIMKQYIHYPKYLIPATLAGEIAINLPIVLVTGYFNAVITGFFSFANKVTALPISFIGNAIGEVYRQKAAEEYANNGNCKALFLKTVRQLALLGILPFTVLFFFGEILFSFVFGPDWIIAGQIAKYLSFLIYFQLVSTPLALTITFNKSQKYDMMLQFFRGTFSILSMYLGYRYNDYMLSIKLYSLTFSLYYITHSFLQYRAARGVSV